jgi:uncharacterized damage-inducible protein DinB
MKLKNKPEAWLRGPLPGIPDLLQPVAHALLQAREEIAGIVAGLPAEILWERPAGLASPGFHLRHLKGVLDRLFTYARGEMLSVAQLDYLAREAEPESEMTAADLLGRFQDQVDWALDQLATTDPAQLLSLREVGRKRVPATVQGLLFHAAEHTQRHLGQLLVTVRVLAHDKKNDSGI